MFQVSLLVLAVVQNAFAMRARTKTISANQMSTGVNSSIDLVTCDKMCMQCPDGRNILITRQKSGKATLTALGAGAVSFGFGFPVVGQLAGCSKIGFEFWKDRELQENQPLRTGGFLGVMFITSGLETLEAQTKANTSEEDLQALEQCQRLTDVYMWQAVRGAFSLTSAYARQQAFARKCLSHSQLCGRSDDLESTGALNVARFNPFAHENMCAAPHVKSGAIEATDENRNNHTDGSDISNLEPSATDVLEVSDRSETNLSADDSADVGANLSHAWTWAWTTVSDVLGFGAESNPRPETADVGVNTSNDLESESHATESVDVHTNTSKGDKSNSHPGTNFSRTVPSSQIRRQAILSDAQHGAETIDAAAEVLDNTAREQDGVVKETAVLQDEVVGGAVRGLCRSKSQMERCAKIGIYEDNTCKDRCCMDICRFYGQTTIAGCISRCVRSRD